MSSPSDTLARVRAKTPLGRALKARLGALQLALGDQAIAGRKRSDQRCLRAPAG